MTKKKKNTNTQNTSAEENQQHFKFGANNVLQNVLGFVVAFKSHPLIGLKNRVRGIIEKPYLFEFCTTNVERGRRAPDRNKNNDCRRVTQNHSNGRERFANCLCKLVCDPILHTN